MSVQTRLREILASDAPVSAGELRARLGGIDRATLLRQTRLLGTEVLRQGRARRSAYALRRSLRGDGRPIPIYRIDAVGHAHLVARLSLIQPEGSALEWIEPPAWPLDGSMRDGWFEGLPYWIYDLAPQGFLGRQLAHRHAQALGVSPRLSDWSDSDILHALITVGFDQPGNLVLGDSALEGALAMALEANGSARPVSPADYPLLAERALADGVPGSSAAGEFPKFTARITRAGQPVSVIVKFSGADDTLTARRWSDLLVAEHLALETAREALELPAARSRVEQLAGRTFLEVERFDRVGWQGRCPVCTLGSLSPALLGLAGASWPIKTAGLRRQGWLGEAEVNAIERQWWFGQWIANTDMHDGNLAFRPGLGVAPVYDMLPMRYAPARNGDLPPLGYDRPLRQPASALLRTRVAQAAGQFWTRCAEDSRMSPPFRDMAARAAAAVIAEGGAAAAGRDL